MPRELTLHRYSEWPSHVEWCRRQRAWLPEHGADPADWNAVSPIRTASRRVPPRWSATCQRWTGHGCVLRATRPTTRCDAPQAPQRVD